MIWLRALRVFSRVSPSCEFALLSSFFQAFLSLLTFALIAPILFFCGLLASGPYVGNDVLECGLGEVVGVVWSVGQAKGLPCRTHHTLVAYQGWSQTWPVE